VKYWEIIIKNLRNAGWNCGSMATTDGKGQPIWVVAAERSDAGRFIVHVDEKADCVCRTAISDLCDKKSKTARHCTSVFTPNANL
jgi:hypothetical protein